ncbi:MAG: hypothetical protein KAF40_11725, partial [Flavihumibacter sp.]|nr:hypothetical protein [Flavihumibacter sp.]
MPGQLAGHFLWRENWIGCNAILVGITAFNVSSGYFKQISHASVSSRSKKLSITEVYVITCSNCINLFCNISPIRTYQTPVGVDPEGGGYGK